MKKIILKYIVVPAAAFLAMAGCTDKSLPEESGTVILKTQATGMDADDLTAYVFENGILREIIETVPSGTPGRYVFTPSEQSGTVYFIAGASSVTALSSLSAGDTLDEFLETEASLEELVSEEGIVMTGSGDLKDVTGGVLQVEMIRSVAVFDISVREAGVSVKNVVMKGIADRGFVNGRIPAESPESAVFTEISAAPEISAGETMLLTYVPEQKHEGGTIEVTAEIDGGIHVLKASLPAEISRGRHYSVEIHGNGTGASLTVRSDDWDTGGSSETEPSLRGLIDIDASILPDGVRVNTSCDTVFVSHSETSFRIAVAAAPGSSIELSDAAEGVEAEVIPVSKNSLVYVGAVDVRSALRLPGRKGAVMHADVSSDGVHTGRIVMVFEPNPVTVSGLLSLDDQGVCDFGKYIDGEIAVIGIPTGKKLSLEFGDDESRWLKLDGTANEDASLTVYRLVAGWKPNDPTADGRVQSGSFVISDADGGNPEKYTVKRRNYGLPVVRIGETWWTKYNLRGNVRTFEDQILSSEDPAPDGDVLELLVSASETELLGLMGDQYQGGNPDGLPLRYDGASFYHEGMKSSAQNFGTADPHSMAPDGYMLPDYEDFAFLAASDDYNLGGVGSRQFTNREGQTVGINITERDVSFLGGHYGNVSFYEFEHDGNRWVLYGLGHQWNTTSGNIAVKSLLPATYGDSGRSWMMEGYSAADRPGQNWLKFVAQNTVKTRMIRCVKAPVEYIYE